jgi:hypothetical protein
VLVTVARAIAHEEAYRAWFAAILDSIEVVDASVRPRRRRPSGPH